MSGEIDGVEMVQVRCLMQLYTGTGPDQLHQRGDVTAVPADQVESLVEAGAVEVVDEPEAETEDRGAQGSRQEELSMTRRTIPFATLLLSFVAFAASAQQPAPDPVPDPAPQQVAPPTPSQAQDVAPAENDEPIGVRLAAAVREFSTAVQAAERGQVDVEDAEAEVDRLETALTTAQESTETATNALGALNGTTRDTGEAVIALMTEYLETLPD